MTTGEKPAVLLLHGAIGAAATMRPLARRLAPHFAVHVMDFAGHGAAPAPPAPLTVELLADQVAAYLAAHALAPARLFGYSLGGYVALHLAATRPELVARVQTLATKLAWDAEVAAAMNRGLDPAAIRAKAPKLAAALEAMHTGMGCEALLDATRRMLADLSDRPRLTSETWPRITLPVRMSIGDRDTTVSIEETLTAVRALPMGELEVIPGLPHAIEKMDLDLVARSVVEFLGVGA